MIEAWQVEHRPLAYFFLRRFELVRWTLHGKVFHADAKWYARPRALWLALVGYESERCAFCGGKVGCVWWCDDPILWTTVTGYDENGVSCTSCFEKRAERKGITLRWRVDTLMPYTKDEWERLNQEWEQREATQSASS